MKSVRQFLAAPFYVMSFLIFMVSVVIDLAGCAVVFFGKMVEGFE